MELNLRKARKLEAKIATYLASDSLNAALRVRVQAGKEERWKELQDARDALVKQVLVRDALCSARFSIRKAIADTNHAVGIDALMNEREALTSKLALSAANVDYLNLAEMEDLMQARRASLERGGSNAYEGVTAAVSVAHEDDVSTWKAKDLLAKRKLEDIEDQLSQKNLGAKISLPQETVKLLNSVGLL